MVPEQLEPSVELLRMEYVLVQAWKKTASLHPLPQLVLRHARSRPSSREPADVSRKPQGASTVFGELAERSPTNCSSTQEPTLESARR